MKISEYLDELPDGYRELAVENFIEHRCLDCEVTDMADAILQLEWDDDPTFFSDIFEHYESGLPLPPLPRVTRNRAWRVGIREEQDKTPPLVDKCIQDITDERGKNYGHPVKHFMCTQDMFSSWIERREDAIGDGAINYDTEYPLRHIVYMILDKLSRAAQNPMHMDNFDDIQGYASLWPKCVERNKDGE